MNEGVPPQGEQVPQGVQVAQDKQVPIANQRDEISVVPLDMTNEEVRRSLLTLARAMMAQTN